MVYNLLVNWWRLLRTFAQKNKHICLEVCSLNEIGYPLEQNQRDLTLIQKVFLMKAYPIFNDAQKEASKEPEKETTTDTGFNARYKAKLMENKRKHKQKIGR